MLQKYLKYLSRKYLLEFVKFLLLTSSIDNFGIKNILHVKSRVINKIIGMIRYSKE